MESRINYQAKANDLVLKFFSKHGVLKDVYAMVDRKKYDVVTKHKELFYLTQINN